MLIMQAGDMGPMTIIRPDANENFSPVSVDDESAISTFEDCLALIRRENPAIIIFKLIYTAKASHKIELYYSIRGKDEISPMGVIRYTYTSLSQFKERMFSDFFGLAYPL
ncbi:MAG: hypothetical protein FWC92_03160 [Defluviitaleaceae bacterium]|nr:hypothetical protein [Defluviitaleaceae bacterium]